MTVESSTLQASIASLLSGSSARGDQWTVVVFAGDQVRAVAIQPGQELTIGRATPAQLVVLDKTLSKLHAAIQVIGKEVWIEDLDSTNGVYLQGRRIVRESVEPGVPIQLGKDVTVTVHLSRTAEKKGGRSGHGRFLDQLAYELERAAAFRRPLAMLLIRFASIGQLTSGWAAIHQRLRSVDAVARYADDIAEVLLPEISLETARELGEHLLQASGERQLRIAIASYPEDGSDSDSLLSTAVQRLRATSPGSVTAASPQPTPDAPIARAEVTRLLFREVERVARSDLPVLINGESGTGKEIVARELHNRSARREGPFVPVNCGAIPSELLTSFLFGHEQGAFTGATASRPGVFSAADNGTLFLDEIAELPPSIQVALLRVLETGEVRPVGSQTMIRPSVRIVAATHRDLEDMIRQGSFRQDLLYRINAAMLRVPPLRERPEDVRELALSFVERAASAHGVAVEGIDDEAMDRLAAHDWPGNVRELRNVIERAAVLCRGPRIGLRDLDDRFTGDALASEGGMEARVATLELGLIRSALDACGGNQGRAAERLGVSRRTVSARLSALRRGGRSIEDCAPVPLDDQPLRQRVDQYEKQVLEEAVAAVGRELSKLSERLELAPHQVAYKLKKCRLA